MKIAFRVDASLEIGTGHVMRCLTLAEAMRACGAHCFFISREHSGHLLDHIRATGFEAVSLPPEESDYQPEPNEPAHANWLGCDWRTDVDQARSALEKIQPDWLIVDHYAIDSRWETVLIPNYGKLMVIDDLADRTHYCDLLLDQNLVEGMEERYQDKVPDKCSLLLGPEYALLQPIYAELHDHAPCRQGPVKRILVFFGGTDQNNLTGRTLSAFLKLDRQDIEVDVINAVNSPYADSVREQVSSHNNIHLHDSLPTLAPLMLKADLAIGAGGATSWERVCMGLPTLVITLAENQIPIADSLAQRGLVRWLGHHDKISDLNIHQSLSQFVENDIESTWSVRCLESVDGRGVNRICAVLTIDTATPIRVRRGGMRDEALLLEWANDPVTRSNSFTSEKIDSNTHHKWFLNRINNADDCRLYITETMEGVPVGYVRFDRDSLEWEIHYALASVYRGRRLGRALLEASLIKFRSEHGKATIVGKVKCENRPSIRIFESLGFHLIPKTTKNCSTVLMYRCEYQ